MKKSPLIPVERIEQLILLIRGQKVILDADLAALYGVETKQLIRAVKRNLQRFPDDFIHLRRKPRVLPVDECVRDCWEFMGQDIDASVDSAAGG